MTISSRTPEGTPNRCPVCGHDVCLEPSTTMAVFGDAPCPSCGCLLWFLRLPEEIRFYEGEAAAGVRERVIEIVARYLNVDPDRVEREASFQSLRTGGWDSLDVVELLMEIEESLE